MQYYNTKVRLGGLTTNEVRKILSAPEVLVLQYIHGVDAIVDMKFIREEHVDLLSEKNRLKGLYDQALIKREQSIDNIFGALGVVPEKLPENMLESFDIIDEEDVVAVARQVTAKSKNDNANKTRPETQLEVDRMTGVPSDQIALTDIME